MKILRISLKNIASLAGLHTVDFTREPLASSGLFAICGPTGAGKSTLLDALCISLYEKTPRLNAVKGTVKLPDGEKDELSQKDPANLLRRGTGEGFTEVAFQGVDGLEYTARWIVRRARNNPAGPLQATEAALFHGNLPPGTIGPLVKGGKKTEVYPVIVQKVGLSFEQFTRAVLLAQNDFATFLKASDTDRAEILQALTGTSRFEAISMAVYNRCAEKEKALQNLASQLKGSAPMEAESRAVLDSDLSTARTALSGAAATLVTRLKHKEWFSELARRDTLATQAEALLLEAKRTEDTALPRRQNLARVEAISLGARTPRNKEHAAEKAVAAAAEALTELRNQENCANADYSNKKAALIEAQFFLARAQETLKSQEPEIKKALALDAQMPPLLGRRQETEKHLLLSRNELDGTKAELAKQEAIAARIQADKATLAVQGLKLLPWKRFIQDRMAWIERVQQARDAQKNLTQIEHERLCKSSNADAKATAEASESTLQKRLSDTLQLSEERLSRLNPEALQREFDKIITDRNANAECIDALQNLQFHVQAVDAISSNLETLENEITGFGESLSQDLSEIEVLESTRVPEAKLTLEGARKAFALVAAAIDKAAVHLREALQQGKSCPVCGSEEHPYANHPPTPELLSLQTLRHHIQEHENALHELVAKLAALKNGAIAVRKQIAHKNTLRESLAADLQKAKLFVPKSPEIEALWNSNSKARPALIETCLEELKKRRKTINASEKAAGDAAATIQKAVQEKTEAELSLRKSKDRLAVLRQDLAVAAVQLKEADAKKEACARVFFEKTEALSPVWNTTPAARTDFQSDPDAFADSFAQKLTLLAEIATKETECEQEQREAATAIEGLSTAVVRAEAALHGRQTEHDKAVEAHQEKLLQRLELFGENSAEAAQQALLSAIEDAAKLASSFKLAQDNAILRLTEIAAKITLTETGLSRSELEKSEAAASLNLWLENFSRETGHFLSRLELDEVLTLDDAWFAKERLDLSALKDAVQKARGALESEKARLHEHVQFRPTTDDEALVLSEIPRLEEFHLEKQAVCEQLHAIILNDEQRRAGSTVITSQISALTLDADPWRKLNELVGSSDGAKFRNIAQRRTLDVLLGYANAQLDLLATRYRLERVPQSLNLLVVDRDMADEQRSVHSLSGGESFLVSLALALGLAALTSNRLRIESLFIDEGFGSLDPETLSIATSALMHLQSQGRKVGVISHVSEMAEAIPVQIRVLKGRGGSSRIEVPGTERLGPVDKSALSVPFLGSQSLMAAEAAPEIIAQKILEILGSAQRAGSPLISTSELRKTIGCSKAEFDAGRALASAGLLAEGRSLRLASPSSNRAGES